MPAKKQPRTDIVEVNREEYAALCTMRDEGDRRVTELETKLSTLETAHLKLKENYAECLAVNSKQLDRVIDKEREIIAMQEKWDGTALRNANAHIKLLTDKLTKLGEKIDAAQKPKTPPAPMTLEQEVTHLRAQLSNLTK